MITAEELWEVPEIPGKRFELVRGELVEMPGSGALHNLLAFSIAILLREHVRRRNLGVVCVDGAAYTLARDPDLVRIPAASFVAQERVPEGGVPAGPWPLAPDLAVEIVSPHDRADDVHDKVAEYMDAGTRLVWVLWPKRRTVTEHATGSIARKLGPGDELSGGDVLPGFRVQVARLFEL
jgi:Uma2 family endonuclease